MLARPPKIAGIVAGVLLCLLVAGSTAHAQKPAVPDSTGHTVVPLIFDGTGTSAWGPIVAGTDSTQVRVEDPGLSPWEYPVAGLWWLIKLPFALLNAGLEGIVGWWGDIPFYDLIKHLLSRLPAVGVNASAEWTPSNGFAYALEFYDNRMFDGRLHAHYVHAGGSRGSLVNAVATRAHFHPNTRLDLIASYARRGAERYYGIGPGSDVDERSYFTGRNVWFGSALMQELGADFAGELRVFYSDLQSAAPRDEDRYEDVADVFAGDLPYGWNQHSTGMSYEFELSHDSTEVSGRGLHSGLQRASLNFFHPTSGPGRDQIQYLVGAEQYIGGQGRSGRQLAFKGFWSWIDSGGEPVHFQRMLTNALGDSFRGYQDFRFRDRGILGFTAEYRYPVWDYAQVGGQVGLDGYVFYETGQVFSDHDTIRAEALTHSFGAGLRLLSTENYMARVELAGSREDFIARFSVTQVFQRGERGMYDGDIPVPAR